MWQERQPTLVRRFPPRDWIRPRGSDHHREKEIRHVPVQTNCKQPVLRRNTQKIIDRLPVKHRTAMLRALHAWYRREARDLPWRKSTDAYRVWLAEIILQQTRVIQGTPYYERFLREFPSVEALASASEETVLKCWEGLGYYTRARNLLRCAQTIVEKYAGCFPSTASELQTLPGIGPYTAAAIASIAFGERVAVLDGNVIRVLTRWFNIADCVDTASTRRFLQELANDLMPRHCNPGLHNQAMMELGARICTFQQPQCGSCPVRRYCAAQEAGTVAQRPVRAIKPQIPHYTIVVAAIKQRGRYLLGKRPSEGLLGGLWELPGGKVQEGEDLVTALRREINEELGIEIIPKKQVATVRHAYSHFRVTLHVYLCGISSGKPQARWHTELVWAKPAEFDQFAFPQANRKFLHLL